MLKSYETRVRATYDFVVATLEHVNRDGAALRKAIAQADADTIARAKQADAKLAIVYETGKQSVPFKLDGYAFKQEPSAISGDTWVRYDPKTPKTYTIPFYRDLVATQSVQLPAAYLVPAGWTVVIDKLREHHLHMERTATPLHVAVERYRLGAPHWADMPFEGHHMLKDFTLATERADADFTSGAVLVPLDQPAANLAVNLLEPRASDSLLAWGLLDPVFEQKEYADARVTERLAREMLAKDPALQEEFDARLADPAFAKSPEARLAFFYERSPWYSTQHVGLYPIVRLDAAALERARSAIKAE
jgi:hypothetical protein